MQALGAAHGDGIARRGQGMAESEADPAGGVVALLLVGHEGIEQVGLRRLPFVARAAQLIGEPGIARGAVAGEADDAGGGTAALAVGRAVRGIGKETEVLPVLAVAAGPVHHRIIGPHAVGGVEAHLLVPHEVGGYITADIRDLTVVGGEHAEARSTQAVVAGDGTDGRARCRSRLLPGRSEEHGLALAGDVGEDTTFTPVIGACGKRDSGCQQNCIFRNFSHY
ncbi:MAG: hypothetical protein J6I38_09660 [Prevotella sp.]|nr:hypothetical protein [Prevotella sp.]